MASRFVPARRDFPNQFRETLGRPSEEEKGAPDTARIEKVQHATRVGLYPRGVRLPLGLWHNTRKCFDLKVILDIDA
jgi:hypothetical protein